MFYIIIKTGTCVIKEIKRQTGLAINEFDLISVGELDWGTKAKPQIADGYLKVVYQSRAT